MPRLEDVPGTDPAESLAGSPAESETNGPRTAAAVVVEKGASANGQVTREEPVSPEAKRDASEPHIFRGLLDFVEYKTLPHSSSDSSNLLYKPYLPGDIINVTV